jgi:hypothetical protein
MKTFLKISGAALVVMSASVAYAQSGSGSDVTGPTPGSTVTFAPLPVPTGTGGAPGGGAPSPAAAGTVTTTGTSMAGGTPMTSPATNQPIPTAASQSVGQVISTGSPAAVAQVSAALQGAGAPPGATATLTQALAALAGASPSTAPGLIIGALNAFNSFVQNAPASFFATGTLPPQFLAVHAALVQMGSSIR